MRLRSELTVEQIKDLLREVLEDFKDELIEELREGITQPVGESEPNDPLVRTAEVCLRWGAAGLRSASWSKQRSWCRRDGMGIRLRSGFRMLWGCLAGRFDDLNILS
jgi:hypothetical protein